MVQTTVLQTTALQTSVLRSIGLGAALGFIFRAVWSWLPGLLHGRAQFGVLREGQGGQTAIGLSLSLPDPARIDPDLLRALEGTPISLLVGVGAASRDQPHVFSEQLTVLSAAGHQLGLIAGSSRSLKPDREALERQSGQAVTLTRPSRYHPLTLPRVRRAGLRAIWTGRPGTPETLLDGAEPGGLLNLNSLSAAEVRWLIVNLRERGYRPVPVGELKGLRTETLLGLLQRLYRRSVDARFDRAHNSVALTQRPRGLFRISRRPYAGPPLTLPDGSQFTAGAPSAELHIYSKRLVALAELSALTGLRGVQNSLYDVAQALEERPEFQDVQLIYALTIFAGVLGPMGFQSQPLSNARQARVMAVFFNLLRVLYGAKNTDSQQLLPAVIWMSRSALLARYGAPRRNARNAPATR